ncbi:MAG: hypothetical protein HZB70_01055 [Candidatus Berkelbacteria bacterium]|nr:MAG: hypothetical protein HZB70_01055 [Candidatus Berkelbacteria bacterium]QQG52073.1 MAG: hypothetical protein HY845_01940 [Candidatus Berkelbacteria bacterium]
MRHDSKHHSKKHWEQWLKLNGTGVGVVTISLVVLAGVIGLYLLDIRLSPSDIRTENNVTVRLQVTDHDATSFLINSLTDNSQSPVYNDSQLKQINRETSGRIPTMFRIQGTLTYR